MHALGHAQRALLGVITDGLDAIREAEDALDKHSHNVNDSAPQLGSDPVRTFMICADALSSAFK